MGALLTFLGDLIQAVLILTPAFAIPYAFARAFNARERRRAHRAIREKLLREFPEPEGYWWTPETRERIDAIIERATAHVGLGDFEMVWPNGASFTRTRPKGPLEQKVRELCQRLSRWLSSSRFSPTAPNSGARPSGRESFSP